jgi:hypothetical protein
MAFAERAVDTGVDMLRERVRTSLRPFRNYLIGVNTSSTRTLYAESLKPMGEAQCYPILRSSEVAAVFGLAKGDSGSYPYVTDPTQELAVEQMSAQITTAPRGLTRDRVSNLQRVAGRGAEAISSRSCY